MKERMTILFSAKRGTGKTYLLDNFVIPALEKAGAKITKRTEIMERESIEFEFDVKEARANETGRH